MPDVGVPPSTPLRPVSHTSTNEWQSFEVRMRRRRAERCVLRAEVALEAGFEEDARVALEEARRLDSSAPDIDALRLRLADRHAAEAEARRKAHARSLRRYVTAALVVLTLGAGALLFWPDSPPPTTAVVPPSVVQPPPTATVKQEVVPVRETVETAGAPPAASPEPAILEPRPERASEPENTSRAVATKPEPLIASEATPQPVATTALPLPASAPPPETRPAVNREATPPVTPLSPPVANAMGELPGATPPPAAPEARHDPAPEGELPRIRSVLAQYGAAYSSLDAVSAQEVWPEVDGRSLARAFESLESQRVSLGRCSISIDGAAASATCNGSATWTPKVGGGTRTEPRRWTFELSNASGTWLITRANVR